MNQRKVGLVRARYGMAIGMMALLVSLGMLLIVFRAGRCRSERSESGQCEARWVFALMPEGVAANVLGRFAESTDTTGEDASFAFKMSDVLYENLRSVTEGNVRFIFSRITDSCHAFDSIQASNALANARYEFSGTYIPIITVRVPSEDSEVAVEVLTSLAKDFCREWSEEEDRRFDIALSAATIEFRQPKAAGRAINEDKLKECKRYLEYRRVKIVTLESPYYFKRQIEY